MPFYINQTVLITFWNINIFVKSSLVSSFTCKMYPHLVTFGNVLLDSSFSIEKNRSILAKYDFAANSLGECSSEKLSNVQQDGEKT